MLPEISIFNFSLEGWDKRKGKWQGGWAIILNISVKGGRLFEGDNQSLAKKKIYVYKLSQPVYCPWQIKNC